MAIYKCSVCGYEFDEEKEGKKFSELKECPVCKQSMSKFERIGNGNNTGDEKSKPNRKPNENNTDKHENKKSSPKKMTPSIDLSYDTEYIRHDS